MRKAWLCIVARILKLMSVYICEWISYVNLFWQMHLKIITDGQRRSDSIYFGHRITVFNHFFQKLNCTKLPPATFPGVLRFLTQRKRIHCLTMLNELLSHAISVHQCTGPFISNRNVYLIWKMSGHMVYIVWISSVLFNSFWKSFFLLLSLCCGRGRND